jgi:hypothetical protein
MFNQFLKRKEMYIKQLLLCLFLAAYLQAENGCEFLTAISPVVFSYDDEVPEPGGTGTIGIILYNDSDSSCYNYPGIRITTESDYISFTNSGSCEGLNCFESWWYGMEGGWSYLTFTEFLISTETPENYNFQFTAVPLTLHCEPYCPPDSEPWECLTCPNTEPVQIHFVMDEAYPNRMGDENLDGMIDLLDIVRIISNINSGYYENPEYYYDQDMGSYFADLNQDYSINIQDIVMIVSLIIAG